MLEHITDHFILCGYGRIGSIIATELHQQGVPLVVIERDPERVRQAIERGLARDRGRREPRRGARSAPASTAPAA